MDFSNNVFRPSASSSLSHDTMDHAKMVMACRFGWSAGPSDGVQGSHAPPTTHVSTPPTTSSNAFKINKRFAPCRGRLYHQLTCSTESEPILWRIAAQIAWIRLLTHRAWRSIVTNVLRRKLAVFGSRERLNTTRCTLQSNKCRKSSMSNGTASTDTWKHNLRMIGEHSSLPSRKLLVPATFALHRRRAKRRMDFATELESLSLALASSKTSPIQPLATRESRISLPNDMSEQLHWSLNSLSLERGSCGVEYSPTKNVSHSTMRTLDEGEFWHKPRDQK